MRLRAILAMLVAALLLSVSCSVLECEMACGLQASGMSCHHSSASPVAGAEMIGMQHSPVAAKAVPPAVQSAYATSCTHAGCRQPSQLLAANWHQAAIQAVSAEQASIDSVLFASPVIKPVQLGRFKSPPPHAPPLALLQTILRV